MFELRWSRMVRIIPNEVELEIEMHPISFFSLFLLSAEPNVHISSSPPSYRMPCALGVTFLVSMSPLLALITLVFQFFRQMQEEKEEQVFDLLDPSVLRQIPLQFENDGEKRDYLTHVRHHVPYPWRPIMPLSFRSWSHGPTLWKTAFPSFEVCWSSLKASR